MVSAVELKSLWPWAGGVAGFGVGLKLYKMHLELERFRYLEAHKNEYTKPSGCDNLRYIVDLKCRNNLVEKQKESDFVVVSKALAFSAVTSYLGWAVGNTLQNK